ncbi:hypothetical protein [Luteimonas fraxinea]|uniref:Uncharacterized protein n=1 Tax=Luteimonas fraxinea TaxID=2901869 RepID=A0ABS8UEI7_9GAMM|nr:hypothetical protein [Luteimonas fraxinea]MCD9097083.1 hypothetical protein [Luteimonas fraxinea]
MLDRLIRLLKRRPARCAHQFRGVDIVPRDSAGIVAWPCCKCDFVARVEYGLQVQAFGNITGPWGVKEESFNG